MEEDKEFTKLPLEERCVHEFWQARVHGYEEAAKLFRQIADEKSPEWSQYLGIVKCFTGDSNADALEKGLEALLVFLEKAEPARKIARKVMSRVVGKCFVLGKPRIEKLCQLIALMFIEIEQGDSVMEELIKAFEHYNSRVAAACINIVTMALKEFGTDVINVKPLVKEGPKLLDHRDRVVREAGISLIVEIFRWVGDEIRPQITIFKPRQVTALEAEFEQVSGNPLMVATRFTRSQQQKEEAVKAEAAAVDLITILPKDFYENFKAKTRKERLETLEALEKLILEKPKLKGNNYDDLLSSLLKMIKEDIAAIATRACMCVAGLARGLKSKFKPYALTSFRCVLERFKDAKPNEPIKKALREASDAIAQCLTLETMLEDVTKAIDSSKNVYSKGATLNFLARFVYNCTPDMLNKEMLEAYVPLMKEAMNDSDSRVHFPAARVLGTAMKVLTEEGLMPYIRDVEPIRLMWIKELCKRADLLQPEWQKLEETIAPVAVPEPQCPSTLDY